MLRTWVKISLFFCISRGWPCWHLHPRAGHACRAFDFLPAVHCHWGHLCSGTRCESTISRLLHSPLAQMLRVIPKPTEGRKKDPQAALLRLLQSWYWVVMFYSIFHCGVFENGMYVCIIYKPLWTYVYIYTHTYTYLSQKSSNMAILMG